MMVTLRDDKKRFPHIQFRDEVGHLEPYVASTGLAIWEIAWLARAYGDDVSAVAEHTGADPGLLDEGLRYAREHCQETETQIVRHTEHSLEDLLKVLPGMRVIDMVPDDRTSRH